MAQVVHPHAPGPSPDPPRGAADPTLRAFLAGDPAACRTVERWAWEIVYYRGFRVGRDEVEDVVQEAVGRIWRVTSAPGFTLQVSLRAYVQKTAAALAIDRLRRRRPSVEIGDDLPSAEPDPYERLLASDLRAQLYWTLQQLGDRCREIIRRHFFEGEPYAELAAGAGCAEATMRVHMFNCMKEARRLAARWLEP